ncbi:hypothetical protein ACTTZI_004182 [Vibrio vulnificus]
MDLKKMGGAAVVAAIVLCSPQMAFAESLSMTFDDAVAQKDNFTISKPTQDQLEKEWVIHNKPAENAVIDTDTGLELIAENVNSTRYDLKGLTGQFVVYAGGVSSFVYVSSSVGTFHSTSSVGSNSSLGVTVQNGVLVSHGVYSTPTIKKVFRVKGSEPL